LVFVLFVFVDFSTLGCDQSPELQQDLPRTRYAHKLLESVSEYAKRHQDCQSPGYSLFRSVLVCERGFISFHFRFSRFVPFLILAGMYQTDLLMIDSGNPDEVNGLINMTKYRLSTETIKKIRQYQLTGYSLKVVEDLYQV
jgi:hypothetical protein